MHRVFPFTGLLLALLLVAPAARALDLHHFVSLVNAGQSTTAFALLSDQTIAEREGEPHFDLHYGIAAIDNGRVAEGIFALERVVMAQPRNWRARLELARGYFLLGEDARARREFNLVLDHAEPPAEVVANIERFLNAIRLRESRYATTATAWLEMSVGYDDNVNSAPANGTIFAPLFNATLMLPDESLAQSSTAARLALGGQVSRPLTPGWALFGALDGSATRYFDADAYDSVAGGGQLGLTWRGETNRWRLAGLGQQFQLDGEVFRNAYGVNGEWTHHYSPRTQFTANANHLRLEYPDQPLRDGRQLLLGVGVQHQTRGPLKGRYHASLFGGHERTDNRTDRARALAERDIQGVRLGGQWVLRPTVVGYLTLTAQQNDYAGLQILFDTERQDTLTSVDAGATWLLGRHWRLRGSVGHSRNDSNIELYEYTRNHGMVGLRYEY